MNGGRDPAALRRGHTISPQRHVPLDLELRLRRVARQLYDRAPRIPPLGLQLHQSGARHHLREGRLERGRLIDIPVQSPRNIVPVEDALLPGDDGENLLRPLADA